MALVGFALQLVRHDHEFSQDYLCGSNGTLQLVINCSHTDYSVSSSGCSVQADCGPHCCRRRRPRGWVLCMHNILVSTEINEPVDILAQEHVMLHPDTVRGGTTVLVVMPMVWLIRISTTQFTECISICQYTHTHCSNVLPINIYGIIPANPSLVSYCCRLFLRPTCSGKKYINASFRREQRGHLHEVSTCPAHM